MSDECQEWMVLLTSEGMARPGWSVHLAACATCRENWELHHRLQHWESESFPSEESFRHMRQKVHARIKSSRPRRIWSWALPLAACVLGFAVGLGWKKSPSALLPGNPVQYSDFRILANDGTKARFGYLVNHYVETDGSLDDPLFQQLLAQSLRNSPDLATRLDLLDDSRVPLHAAVKKALLEVCLKDPELVVRAKAIDRLSSQRPDPETIDVMIQILRREDHVHLRLKALDYLSQLDQPDSKVLGALRALESDPEPAVRVGVQDYSNLQ